MSARLAARNSRARAPRTGRLASPAARSPSAAVRRPRAQPPTLERGEHRAELDERERGGARQVEQLRGLAVDLRLERGVARVRRARGSRRTT